MRQSLEGARPGTLSAEWKNGTWHVSPAIEGREADIRSLAELRAALVARGVAVPLHDERFAPTVVLPRAVQRHLDVAEALDAAGRPEAAAASRGTAARLLRSKRMSDDDIAHCLGVPLEVVREHLPDLRH